MITDSFPDADAVLSESCRMGVPHHDMNKLSLFDPNDLSETNFSAGRHFAQPAGRVVYPESDELLNLHYKYLGLDFVVGRNEKLATGLGPHDRQAGLGEQYAFSRDAWVEAWPELKRRSLDYRDPTVGFSTHIDRWWRGRRRRG